ncbi:MAG: WecB/TagA/CpsF family glycosyltransferase [Thiotrichales bacterium]
MMMRKNEPLRAACSRADLTVADGVPVVWATRLVGDPLAERVAGVDLMSNLLQAGHEAKLRFFFLGAKQEVLDTLRGILESRYPDLVIAGMRNGYFGEANNADAVAEIKAARADILFIGMPTPFKEIWAERHRQELDSKVIIGVGGSFDVLAGYVKRAPLWMQKIGMEWFWRLRCEPRKMWKRYLVTNTQFLFYLGREVWWRRLLGQKAPTA